MAIFLVIILPLVLLFWGMIHAAPRFWQRVGMAITYSVAFLALAAATVCLYLWRGELIGSDLGMNWLLFVPGAALYAICLIIDRNTRRHLDFRTFAGVPELKGEAGELLQSGPFGAVRHPRYSMVLLGVFGWCLMINYTGTYLLGVMFTFGLWLVVQLEERDLRRRFGKAYVAYARRVPQLLPRRDTVGLFLK
ncbi:MAG: isoprenylcysteine carboxylmethyltransferase family protein [Pseudomonadota bacterium]